MAKQPLSDEELIARAQRRFRESLIAGLALGLAIAGLMLAYTIADKTGVFQRLGYDHTQTEIIYPWLLGVVAIAFIAFTLVRYWQPKAERSPRLLRKDMDNVQRRGHLVMLILIFVALEQTIGIVLGPQDQNAFTAGALLFGLCVMATLVCFGPGWLNKTYRETVNDELVRALRARAIRLGYLVLIPALAALYLVLQYRPDMAARALIGTICGATVIPALYFIIADWRAGREE